MTALTEQEDTRVLQALASLYTTIISTDLRTHASRTIRSVTGTQKALGSRDESRHEENVAAMAEHFLHPEDREAMLEFFDLSTLPERLRGKDFVTADFRSVQGRWYEGRFLVEERDAAGVPVTVLFVSREITWEKEKELGYLEQLRAAVQEAESANLSKTNFLRRMSHDIRTPLNGIIGMLRLLDANRDNPEKYEEYREKIQRSADYLLNIINNVLDVGKMESGEIELEYRPFDLEKLLRNTLPIIATNASQNSVVFVEREDDIRLQHRYVIGSPTHLNRVLMNLASNAVKYNRRGGTLHVQCRETKSDGLLATYEFLCEDTGLGMSEEFCRHAFEPFTREGKETTTGFSGSGLGLSIVKKIVDKMGGTVEVESREGVGSTFRVVLSLTLDAHEGKHAAEEAALPLPDCSGRRALLVEDNEINMEIASILLGEMGFTVTGAKNGAVAVDLFQKAAPYTFDFIFMDMMMPVMDGLTATRTIRTLAKEDAATIPIIAMTANAFAEDKAACLAAGMNDHIGKPIELREVARALRPFLSNE